MRYLGVAGVFCFVMGAARTQGNSPSTKANNLAADTTRLLGDFESRASAGKPRPNEDAEPLIERFENADEQSVEIALPQILRVSTSSYKSVRSVSAMALFAISLRPEGRVLLSPQTSAFAALLIDPDTPIRRVTGLALANLRLEQTSPMIREFEAFLLREDAVTTTGAGVAGLLMQAAPEDPTSTAAVVHYMERKDQTPTGRRDLLQSVRVARSHNREIGREVADYADTPDEDLSVDAIRTLRAMGVTVVSANRRFLMNVEKDGRRGSAVRKAATNALASLP